MPAYLRTFQDLPEPHHVNADVHEHNHDLQMKKSRLIYNNVYNFYIRIEYWIKLTLKLLQTKKRC